MGEVVAAEPDSDGPTAIIPGLVPPQSRHHSIDIEKGACVPGVGVQTHGPRHSYWGS